jgi:15-cis-phytoene desaturase
MLPVALRRLGLGDALSHLRVAWQAARANEATLRELDALDALTWLRLHGVSARAIDWFWRSAMLALLNVPLEQCSAAAAMRVFRLMLGRSGYHFGFPKVGLSRLYVPGCVAAVRAAGGEVLTGSVVQALETEAGTFTGIRLRGGATVRAPWCVLAVAPWNLHPLLERTREPLLARLAADARRFVGAPYTSTVLVLDRAVTQHRFWARVWNPEDHNTDFYDLANIRPALRGSASVIAANAIGPLAHHAWSDEQVIARTMAELAELSPAARDARVLHASIHRIRAAIPQPRPGTEMARPGTRTGVNGLLLAGDWVDTAVPCSMESAARSAALAAGMVLGKPLALAAPDTYGWVGSLRKPMPPGVAPSQMPAIPRFTGTHDALAYFDALAPVQPAFLQGEWLGEECPTGHPFDGLLTAYGWHGKRFDAMGMAHPLLFGSTGHVFEVQPRWPFACIPLVLRFPGLKEERVARWLRPLLALLRTHRPRASVRMIEHRGSIGAAMLYDEVPVVDFFRRVDENTVLGLMELKGLDVPYFFALRRAAPRRTTSNG